VGSEDVVGAAVEVLAGGDLHVAQVNTGVGHGRHDGVPQLIQRDGRQ
jgi:hypothetical protein